jgi:hypothetical protein
MFIFSVCLFICDLSNDAVSSYVVIGCLMNDELGRIWKEAVWPNLKYYPGICLEVLRETTNNCQDSQFPGRDLNPGRPE